jgi:hypothetical protein
MSENINGDGLGDSSRNITVVQIPQLSENADIQEALKIYHYGTKNNLEPVAANSIARYLENKINATLIDSKGDILVGSADNVAGKLAIAPGNDYSLVTDSAQPLGLKWQQTDYQENHLKYIMGYYT